MFIPLAPHFSVVVLAVLADGESAALGEALVVERVARLTVSHIASVWTSSWSSRLLQPENIHHQSLSQQSLRHTTVM